ncbi:MAG: sugar phosphate isomerase/epimerase [Fimbriimonadaceae bacterium]|nr:sugar phosphate isomerase/epimerase [Fimbriimonadaceae bacterium]
MRLCVYGLVYTLGLTRDPARANPRPWTLDQLLDFVEELGFDGVELPAAMLPPEVVPRFRERCERAGLTPVIAGRNILEGWREEFAAAAAVGARLVRCTVSRLLEGDRRTLGLAGWRQHLDRTVAELRALAPELERYDLRLGIENHQDATSWDLLELCERAGSERVGITLDTGNPLAVGEDVLAFAERVKPRLVHLHCKDYHLFPTPEGLRLVHAPSGYGVVDFAALFALLADRPDLSRSLELPALDARHVRLLCDDWWAGYPPRDVTELLPVLRLREQRASRGEWRTPWETGDLERLAAWEQERVVQSVGALRAILGDAW